MILRTTMLGAQICVRMVSFRYVSMADQTIACGSFPTSIASCSHHFSASTVLSVDLTSKRSLRPKSLFISCHSSRGNSRGKSSNLDDSDGDYLEASLLLSETILHYHMRMGGSKGNVNFHFSNQLIPFSTPTDSIFDINSLEQELFRRFQSPTIFLKISCDGDFVLPIIVGEFAIEKLKDGQLGNDNGNSPDHIQFIRNLVEKLGYEVVMVRITERVVNTYYARLYFSKPGENEMLSVDARPSDAINVANRCKVPIYVSKQIVFTDAIKIGYGMGRVRNKKSTYDVQLDSATEGTDLVGEELNMVTNMNLAILEERYRDAAMWRDKLAKLRKTKPEQ